MAKFFKNFPNKPGIVIARDVYNNHLFTMYTDNIRARTEHIDWEFREKKFDAWGESRRLIAEAAGAIAWSFIECSSLSKEQITSIGKALDSQSMSKI